LVGNAEVTVTAATSFQFARHSELAMHAVRLDDVASAHQGRTLCDF
jgi:hypothetical protein